MDDLKRIKISGTAIPLRGNDIDTDRIIPARFLKCVTFDGLGEHAFEDDRLGLRRKGETHPFDNPAYAGAEILLVNKNFGCGSSREHAPQSIMRWGRGIKAIIGESFAEIFFGNCAALGMPAVLAAAQTVHRLQDIAERNPATPFTVDIEKLTVTAGTETFPIELPEGVQQAYLKGEWDTTGALLAAADAIRATAANLPYFNHWK
jgi:3-isopropylmalate/(R)-2-methylmalate dehydratase small subunit